MTTIERAKKFYKHIHLWAGEPSSEHPSWRRTDMWTHFMEWCQARVARALIRQELRYRRVLDSRRSEGLQDALEILDAVYGRDNDNT